MSASHTSSQDAFRTQPMYSFGEAARLAQVSSSTVRNWLFGYTSGDRQIEPLFNGPSDIAMVSFLQLIEITVAARFRKVGHVSFAVVRRAYENAQETYDIDYPFAHLRLETMGGHIVQRLRGGDKGASLQAVDQPTQWSLPGLLAEVVDQLDYEREFAIRWHPAGKSIPIVVDPLISSGVPVFEGRGVTITAIRKRWKAGQSIDFIAQDFKLEPKLVETTLRYADSVAA
ncbi:MAG: DUF433 domain-containing protein [Chloroflexi bacterium]|nr:DUF433 domain-containing protein [Chloroflexota bacterium]